jgi:hypothetical protein
MLPILRNIFVFSPASGFDGNVLSSTSKFPILWVKTPPVKESEYANRRGKTKFVNRLAVSSKINA